MFEIIQNDNYLYFNFVHRHFPLVLKPDKDVFSDDHVLEEYKGQGLSVDTSHIYSGYVQSRFHFFVMVYIV